MHIDDIIRYQDDIDIFQAKLEGKVNSIDALIYDTWKKTNGNPNLAGQIIKLAVPRQSGKTKFLAQLLLRHENSVLVTALHRTGRHLLNDAYYGLSTRKHRNRLMCVEEAAGLARHKLLNSELVLFDDPFHRQTAFNEDVHYYQAEGLVKSARATGITLYTP